jgi:hypothetical protein
MHTRLLLLISLALMIPSAGWALLGPSGRSSFSSEPVVTNPAPAQGLPGVSGRANPRAAEFVLGFPPPPPPAPDDTSAGGGSEGLWDPVPEPSPAVLTALGLLALAFLRRQPA